LSTSTFRTHISRFAGEHYKIYREKCEAEGLVPHPRCAPMTDPSVAPSMTQTSMDSHTVAIQEIWSRSGLEARIREFVVINNLVQKFNLSFFLLILNFFQSYRLINHATFRELLMFQRPATKDKDIFRNATLNDNIFTEYMKVKGLLTEKFKNNDSLVSFTFDAGTSKAYDPYLALTAHWINSDFKVNNQLLAFREIVGDHTGANTGELVINILMDYRLCNKDKVS
jgi:hypothetical protein